MVFPAHRPRNARRDVGHQCHSEAIRRMIRHLLGHAARSAWLALLAATIIVVAQMASKPPRPIYADEFQYLTVSRNLVIHGVYSDETVSDQKKPDPSAFFAPVAPMLYGLLLKIDPALRETIACQFAN